MDPLTIALLVCIGVLAALVGLSALHSSSLRSSLDARAQALAHLRLQQWRTSELDGLRQQYEAVAKEAAESRLGEWKLSYEREIRQDAIDRSKAVIVGKVAEHVVPYMPEFGFNPKDARFIGSPVDFVVFDGLDEGGVRSVVFIEVKTGRSTLTARERAIRDAIREGRVKWCEIRVGSPALAVE